MSPVPSTPPSLNSGSTIDRSNPALPRGEFADTDARQGTSQSVDDDLLLDLRRLWKHELEDESDLGSQPESGSDSDSDASGSVADCTGDEESDESDAYNLSDEDSEVDADEGALSLWDSLGEGFEAEAASIAGMSDLQFMSVSLLTAHVSQAVND